MKPEDQWKWVFCYYCECKQETWEQGYIILRLLSTFWDTYCPIVSDPKPTPVWITFSILGTRLAFSPTLSLHWHHSIVLCVIVNTCKPNNNLASYPGSSPEKHFSGEEPGYEANKNQSDLEKRKSYKTLSSEGQMTRSSEQFVPLWVGPLLCLLFWSLGS